MDLTHSAWSDIFFLGMDFPEGARVLNVSIDLGVRGRDTAAAAAGRGLFPRDRRAGVRLVSVDLAATAEITSWPRSSILRAIIWVCSRRR